MEGKNDLDVEGYGQRIGRSKGLRLWNGTQGAGADRQPAAGSRQQAAGSRESMH